MGHWCCVMGCSSNSRRRRHKREIRFFSFPTWKRGYGEQMEDITKRRRLAWIAAVRRKNITFNKMSSFARVCSRHFHKGKPAYEMMESDPDWAPSLNLGYTDTRPTDTTHFARGCNREPLRNINTPQAAETGDAGNQDGAEVKQEAAEGGQLQTDEMKQEVIEDGPLQTDEVKQEVIEGGPLQTDEMKQEVIEDGPLQTDEMKQEVIEGGPLQTDEVKQEPAEESCQLNSGNGTSRELLQTECNMCVLRHAEVNRLLEENRELRCELDKLRITDDFFGDDDDKVKYYTGLPDLAAFKSLFTFLLPLMSVNKKYLTPFQMLLLTFMRLRLDLPVQHVAHLFQVSPKTVYRTFNEMVSFLYTNLGRVIEWPDKETLHDVRVTGNVCQKYKILTGTIPVNMILPCDGEGVTTLDKIITVCCALTNHCPTIF